jgi:hypothetical protein
VQGSGRLQRVRSERAARHQRRQNAVKKIALACVVAAAVATVVSDRMTPGRRTTTDAVPDPASALPSELFTPLADARSLGDEVPPSAGQSGGLDQDPDRASPAPGPGEPPNMSESRSTAIPARQRPMERAQAAPVEKQVNPPSVKDLSEGPAKSPRSNDSRIQQLKDADSPAQGRSSPASRGDAGPQAAPAPDAADVIDWLLKEYLPRRE